MPDLSGSIVQRAARYAVLFGLAAAGAAVGLLMIGRPAHAAPAGDPVATDAARPTSTFTAPLSAPLVVLRGFAAPAEPWLAGNRGADLAANTGAPVFAAASGVVRFAGELAGRGVVSIDHGGGLRTTYEPIDPAVRQGQTVSRGEVIGHVSGAADHCGPPGRCLHWGAIEAGTYIDPMTLLNQPHRIRLLPIWTRGVPTAPSAPSTAAAPLAPAPARTAATTSPGAASLPHRRSPALPVATTVTVGLVAVGSAAAAFVRRRTAPP